MVAFFWFVGGMAINKRLLNVASLFWRKVLGGVRTCFVLVLLVFPG
jgi:hypothetical protein